MAIVMSKVSAIDLALSNLNGMIDEIERDEIEVERVARE